MKKITQFSFFLCAILVTNSLEAMFNSNNKRMKDEEQSDANNKCIKTNNDHEKSKNLPAASSNIQVPQQPYQISTYSQYNTNNQNTNNIAFNLQTIPIINFIPTYPLFVIPNNYAPTPQSNSLNINMDYVKQYLANNEYITQKTQPLHQENINHCNTYVFNFKETREISKIYSEIIKPIGTVTHVVFKMLPSLQHTNFLSKKFPFTQKIDASALFGERFSNIHLNQNEKNIFHKFYMMVEQLKNRIIKKDNDESLLLMDIKRNILNFILNAYTTEPQNPCNHINIFLDYEQKLSTLRQNYYQNINNNNNIDQNLPQKPYIPINMKQSSAPSQPKKLLPIAQNTNTLKNFQQIPIQNIHSTSPFAENNSNNITFFIDSFINSILSDTNPIEDILELSSENQCNLDFFYTNDTTDSTHLESTTPDHSPYSIISDQTDTIFIFDNNERTLLSQKIKLPMATNINALHFKICPTIIEFFELTEFFYNVQKLDFSFVLKDWKQNILQIVKIMKNLNHLKELTLQANQLTDEIIIWIAKELQHLESLNIDHNFIADKGADAISHMDCLKELSLNSNHLTDQGVIKLAGMPNLMTFHYDNNLISDNGKKVIYQMRKEVMFLHNTD